MRIGFLGKGGSGKTTLAAAFIQHIAKTQTVLAIDADQNTNLAHTLGIEGAQSLSSNAHEVADYLRGTRTDLGTAPMIATTPPSLESRFVRVRENDEFLKRYATRSESISLIQGGTYEADDVGVTCYHGKLNAVEMLFHHLLDTEDDTVVTDATAGLDSLGHSMGIVHDLIIYVVEPTRKSIDVYEAFMRASEGLDLNVRVVANKIRSDEERAYVTSRIPKVLAFVEESETLRAFERTGSGMDSFIEANSSVLEVIRRELETTPKDWNRYYERLLAMHEKSAKAWYDSYHNSEISKQKDERFSYERVL
ncbi:MAG: hypothetical protein ACMXYM_03505 [Candidatus Woesearchaeota archaeon]